MKNLDIVVNYVSQLRNSFGTDVCTDVTVANQVASFTVQPDDDVMGYRQQVFLPTMEERHCGLGCGCFWTDWEPF